MDREEVCDLCGNTGICASCGGKGKIRADESCDMCDGTGRCFCYYGQQRSTVLSEDIIEEKPLREPTTRDDSLADNYMTPRDDSEDSKDEFKTSKEILAEKDKMEDKSLGYGCIMGISLIVGIAVTFIEGGWIAALVIFIAVFIPSFVIWAKALARTKQLKDLGVVRVKEETEEKLIEEIQTESKKEAARPVARELMREIEEQVKIEQGKDPVLSCVSCIICLVLLIAIIVTALTFTIGEGGGVLLQYMIGLWITFGVLMGLSIYFSRRSALSRQERIAKLLQQLEDARQESMN